MAGFTHIDDADCPCGPSIVYVHEQASDGDITESRDLGQCRDAEEYAPGSEALCTLYRGHLGDHYRPHIQGHEVSVP